MFWVWTGVRGVHLSDWSIIAISILPYDILFITLVGRDGYLMGKAMRLWIGLREYGGRGDECMHSGFELYFSGWIYVSVFGYEV